MELWSPVLKQLLIVILLAVNCLYALTAEYYVKALGMKISYISISVQPNSNSIEVKTHSLKTSRLFPQIDNVYRIARDPQGLSCQYYRTIRQKNLSNEVSVDYNYQKLIATQKSKIEPKIKNYHISKDSRDVFSLLAMIVNGEAKTGCYRIDANGVPWQATLKQSEAETLKTQLGEYPTKRYDIVFKCLSKEKTPYIDMVTFNLVNEDTKLSFWVSDNNVAVKALVRKNAMAMNWELIGLSP